MLVIYFRYTQKVQSNARGRYSRCAQPVHIPTVPPQDQDASTAINFGTYRDPPQARNPPPAAHYRISVLRILTSHHIPTSHPGLNFCRLQPLMISRNFESRLGLMLVRTAGSWSGLGGAIVKPVGSWFSSYSSESDESTGLTP